MNYRVTLRRDCSMVLGVVIAADSPEDAESKAQAILDGTELDWGPDAVEESTYVEEVKEEEEGEE